MKIALTFPGQGSQAVGMGLAFYESFPQAREVFEEVDDALNEKLSTLMFEGPLDELTLTRNAQPALMATSMAIYRTIESQWGIQLASKTTLLAGHSLGEYTAYCASGALSLADTARLLRIRGTAMQDAVPVGHGAMAALLGLDLDAAESLVADCSTPTNLCVVANDNSPGQVVISGHKEAVDRAIALAPERGAKRAMPLPVSAPFHSPLMAPAAEKMAQALATTSMASFTAPILANVTTELVTEPETAKRLLVDQVVGRVRWRESMGRLRALNVTHCFEIGSGKVLTGLLKRIDSDINAFSVGFPQELEAFFKIVEK